MTRNFRRKLSIINWVTVAMIAQIILFSIFYRSLETIINPVSGNLQIVEPVVYYEEKYEVLISFDKYRDCIVVGAIIIDPTGARVPFEDISDPKDSKVHFPSGSHFLSGPYMIYSLYKFEELRIELLHKCDSIGLTRSILQEGNR